MSTVPTAQGGGYIWHNFGLDRSGLAAPAPLEPATLDWQFFGIPAHDLLVFTTIPEVKMHNGQLLNYQGSVKDEADWTPAMKMAFRQVRAAASIKRTQRLLAKLRLKPWVVLHIMQKYLNRLLCNSETTPLGKRRFKGT